MNFLSILIYVGIFCAHIFANFKQNQERGHSLGFFLVFSYQLGVSLSIFTHFYTQFMMNVVSAQRLWAFSVIEYDLNFFLNFLKF